MPTTPAKTPERRLAEAAVVGLAARERRTAKALLLAERATLGRYRKTIQRSNAVVVAAVAASDSVDIAKRAAALVVRRETPAMQAALHHDTVLSASDAREAARQRLQAETKRPLPVAASAAHLDEAAAATSSASLASAWGGAVMAAAAAWDDKSSPARELTEIPKAVDGRARRTAATETARAFNDERGKLIELLTEALSGGHGGDHPGSPERRPGLYKVWSAVLDAVTCAYCFGADGEIAEPNASFKAGMIPAHPNCRCVVEHIVIPVPERIEDIGIDYDLLKQELRDVIREGRAESQRHALQFVSESLGSKRSPLALTKRFANESYATRR